MAPLGVRKQFNYNKTSKIILRHKFYIWIGKLSLNVRYWVTGTMEKSLMQ